MAEPAIPTDRPGDLAGEPRAFSPHRSGMNRGAMIGAGLLIVLAAGGVYYYYGWQQRPAAAPPAESPALAIASPAAALPAPAESSIQHPIEPATGASTSALTLDQSDPVIAKAWADLLGAKAAATQLQSGDFVRRLVATVDGLGRSHAAPRLWPNQPTLGRFTVQVDGGAHTIGAANAARYAVFIALAESIDTARAAAAYKQHYPLFQAAYTELGYPRGYFNDRLVEVIDQLLATPEPAAPLALRLIEVKGEVASTQPWTRYEFTDPQLEALPAGPKMLLRMGNDNARRLKAQLQAFRALIATPPPAAPAR
jgi:hypothetical protein